MNRRTLVRGIQLIVGITLATFTFLTYRDVSDQKADLLAVVTHIKPFWLVVAAILALQEGVFGGLRVFVLGRVLSPQLKARTAIISEFVLMFCAGVTPGQAGAAPSQIGVLVHGGMRLVDVATASMVTGVCTMIFFLASALGIYVLRLRGLLVVNAGQEIDVLLAFTVTVFGSALMSVLLCTTYPPLLKAIIRVIAVPCGVVARSFLLAARAISRLRPWADAQLAKPRALRTRLIDSIDEFHQGFVTFLHRGKLAYLAAQLLTFGFFCSRFAVAYFILLGLGISTTPTSFVTVGPPLFQVVLIQALLNFALYLSPTPGSAGIAELGSTKLMGAWVTGIYAVPYLALWRFLSLFLCMFVGGIYVFRYLGTDVLEERVKAAEAEKASSDAERLANKTA